MIAIEKSQDKGSQIKELESLNFIETDRSIPIYNLRNVGHHEDIAKGLATGAKIAMFGGVWGVFKGVAEKTEKEIYFHTVKKGRPQEAKIAMLTSPETSVGLIDWQKVHPDFKHLQDLSEFQKLWSSHGAFLHIIGPVKSFVSLPEVFQTTPKDYKTRYPNAEQIQSSTACFVWRDDPYLENVTNITKKYLQQTTYIGVSTLNPHGKEPPYTYEELVTQLKSGQIDPNEIDMIIRDSIYEPEFEFLGSHTQIRLPLNTETPILKVMRVGSLSPEGFQKYTGHKVEVIADVKDVRKFTGKNIDLGLEKMKVKIKNNWEGAGKGL